MEELKNNKSNTQQTTNVTILNNLNNTNIISKSNKQEIITENKEKETPIGDSMVLQTIKKYDFNIEKKETQNNPQNVSNINNIIYDVNSNISDIISKINNNINNESSNTNIGKTTSGGVSVTFNISSDSTKLQLSYMFYHCFNFFNKN